MKKRLFLLAVLAGMPAFAQDPAGPAGPIVPATEPAAAKLFRSRLAGIEFLPPAGGTMIRQLDAGEIVRYVYPEKTWDIRVKPIPLSKSVSLADLVQLMAKQLRDTNGSAEVLSTKTVNIGGKDIGLIEARYNSSVDRLFTQQALVRNNDDESYYLIQLGSPTGKAKGAAANPADPQETDARAAFQQMLPTVQLLDRGALLQEQQERLSHTHELWMDINKKKVTDSLIPLHFMRVLHDGKDVGFIQMNERLASHGGNAGVEIILHSRVDDWPTDPADVAAAAAAAPSVSPQPGGVVLSQSITAPVHAAVSKLPSTYTSATYFFSFDRPSGFVAAHEDWETTSQVDDLKAGQITEMGNSDVSEHRVLDFVKAANHAKNGQGQQPPVIDKPEYLLSVSQYQKNHRLGKAFEAQLGPSYLPQGLGQIIARLMPSDPQLYMFSTFISGQHNVLRRYIDVDSAVDVVFEGKTYHAIPISDRIGVDGIPTVQYVTRTGQWVGSRNDEARIEMLPTDETELGHIWPKFTVTPEPPLPVDVAPITVHPEGHLPSPALPQPLPQGPAQELQPPGVEGR